MSINYEALGRYTAAEEAAIRAITQRDSALSELSRRLQVITRSEGGGLLGAQCDLPSLRALLDEAASHDATLAEAIAEANAVATEANRYPLRLMTLRSAAGRVVGR